MKIKYYNRNRLFKQDEKLFGATYCSSMEELLSQSDVLSVHCPLNDTTVGLIGEKEFARMKDGVFFINTARGAIVDEAALIAALKSGKVERAGLDVFDGEPKIK
jgi:lactate dehydrogenase-like 2-hydroxyacid dehydrogenase